MSFGALSAEAKTALARGAEGAGTGDLLGRGRHAARGAGGVHPLLLRAGLGPLRLGRGVPGPGAGVPPQARPGREDRHRRAPARCQGRRADRRGAGPAGGHAGRLARPVPRLDDAARRPRGRRPDPGAVRRHPGRGQDVGPAHRGRPRRRAGPRRRLRDPRRPRRRHRRRADDLPRHHLRADHGRARPGPAAPRPGRRARRHAGRRPGASGGAQDIVKALALGADAVAVSNVALQAIGCVGMRACHTDNCPVGIATQKPHLRARLPVRRGGRAARPGSSRRSPS